MTGRTDAQGLARRGRSFPYGAWGVAALAAGLGVLAGLVVPMGWIEEVSWQLYLDQIIAAARPPLGETARLAAVAVLALGLGLIGWALGKLLKLRASAGSVLDWVAGLSGERAGDEPDAPVLRTADRHPDAPARRPFSAARDVPVEEEASLASGWTDADDGDELLLDAHFDEAVTPVAVDKAASAARWEELEAVDSADAGDPRPADVPAAVGPVIVESASAPPAVEPAPLDLSIARLDELIARLEAGLARRETAPPPAAVAEPVVEAAPAAPEPVVARGMDDAGSEPGFPHDPALAAALATLRRMNRST